MVEEGKVVTLPEEASFGDAELSLEALPEEAPANAVALLQYVYNERKVGQAYLLDKTIQVPAETEPSGGDAAEPGTEDGSGETGSAAQELRRIQRSPQRRPLWIRRKQDGRFSHEASEGCDPWCVILRRSWQPLGPVSGWSGSGREGKKRRRQPPGDREHSRQRLMEEGPEAAAEFNRLLEEKKNRSQGRGHRRWALSEAAAGITIH